MAMTFDGPNPVTAPALTAWLWDVIDGAPEVPQTTRVFRDSAGTAIEVTVPTLEGHKTFLITIAEVER